MSSSLELLLNKEIICFQHCQLNERIICLNLPEKCPSCFMNLRSKLMPSKFKVPPFLLETPLKIYAFMPSFSLLLQPSKIL